MGKRRTAAALLCALLLTGCAGSGAVEADGTAQITEEVKYVALTFDDGPRRATTTRLLDGLKERGAAATFFLVGEEIAGNEDLIRRMAEEGHQVGNHTWSHMRLENASPETVRQEIQRTGEALDAILGPGSYWLRPPYGLLPAKAETLIPVPMVKWSVDPRDWESRDAKKVTDAILKAVKPNSIILLHDIYPTSVDAALQVVDTLQAQGYWFVTVEELLTINGIKPEKGVMYRSGDLPA